MCVAYNAPRLADGPGIQRRLDLGDHRGQLAAIRGARRRAEDGPPDRAVAHEERHVRTERLPVDDVEVLGEARPAGDEAVRPQRQLDQLAARVGDRRK
jgi:hypothetical protein